LIDYKQHAYGNGSFLFVNRDQVHVFDRSARLQGVGLVLTRSFVEAIRSNIRQPVLSTEFALRSEHPVPKVENLLKTGCQNLLSEIADVSGGGDHDKLMVQLLLVSLLLKLRLEQPGQYSSLLSEKRLQQYAHFITLVNDSFVAIKDASQYAHMMGLTYKSLNQLCKLASNQTPNKYIQHNPQVPDGLSGLMSTLESMPEGSVKVDVIRAFEDNEFVFVHASYDFFGPKVGFDVFRFEDGLIVEHWDNL